MGVYTLNNFHVSFNKSHHYCKRVMTKLDGGIFQNRYMEKVKENFLMVRSIQLDYFAKGRPSYWTI